MLKVSGRQSKALDYGCIRPRSNMLLSDRYLTIYEAVCSLIDQHNPDAVSIETQFVRSNPQTAIKLGMARGAVVIAARKCGIEVFEYTPTKAKLAVVGTGRASKAQVQGMTTALLSLPKQPPEDAADALALAICHAHAHQTKTYLQART